MRSLLVGPRINEKLAGIDAALLDAQRTHVFGGVIGAGRAVG